MARKCLEEGYSIVGLKRANSDTSFIQDIVHQIEWVEGDVLDIPILEKCIAQSTYVIHCAALVSFAPKERNLMYKINVEGTANVVNTCLNFPIQKLCFISSVAALGRNKDNDLVTEKSEWLNSDLNSHYAITKHLAEMEVWRGFAEGLPIVILNPSVVLGLSDWHRSSTQIFRYVWKENWFYSTGRLNYVDVRDVAEATFRLLLSEISGERYILNAGTADFSYFFELIAQNFQKRPPRYPVNGWIASFAWRFFYLISLFTGKSPLITRETASLAQKSYTYQNHKIINALQFTFRTFEESTRWTCDALKKHYKLG